MSVLRHIIMKICLSKYKQGIWYVWILVSFFLLGLLPPSKMPNVIVDEGGNHGVMYNNEYYIYVNDMNRRHGDKSGFSQYANVWCTPIVSDCKILGGWDEYGRSCAEKGIIVE